MISLSLLMPDNYLLHLHHTFAISVQVKFHELYQSLSNSLLMSDIYLLLHHNYVVRL